VHRIASLLPSATEIACALGFREQLVGRSHECDHPPGVESLPALTAPELDPSRPSAEIDERVRALVRDGLSVYRVDAARLDALAPTLVLTQDQCEVCAASLRDVEQALGACVASQPRVVSLDPRTLGDVWREIARVAEALGAPERGRALLDRLTERVSAIGERSARLPRPRLACIEWIEPPMAAGHWMPELASLAGAELLFAQPGQPSTWLEWEALAAADPDAIVVMPCGFELARTRAEIGPLVSRPGFRALRASREGRVALADGHHFFNRPGPRLVESLEILCESLHPQQFPPVHRGSAWEPL
jgi:iron complex transport system substrate-binding protein